MRNGKVRSRQGHFTTRLPFYRLWGWKPAKGRTLKQAHLYDVMSHAEPPRLAPFECPPGHCTALHQRRQATGAKAELASCQPHEASGDKNPCVYMCIAVYWMHRSQKNGLQRATLHHHHLNVRAKGPAPKSPGHPRWKALAARCLFNIGLKLTRQPNCRVLASQN